MVRVLRLLEYEFRDAESAEVNMMRWSVPANGAIAFGKHNTVRSSIIVDLREQYPVVNMQYDPASPNLVADENGEVVGIVTHWNPHGVGEAIVQYFDGSATSETIDELIFPNGKEAAMKYMNDKEP